MSLVNPAWLLLLFIPATCLLLEFRPSRSGIPLPTAKWLPNSARLQRGLILVNCLRASAWVLLILALAGPARPGEWVKSRQWAADIMVAFDLSGTMAAEDFPPNRLVAAKRILAQFVRRNADQRLGLVVYKARVLTLCPLTTDTDSVAAALESSGPHLISEDGTAIGDAIATCLNRFVDNHAPHKFIVLLTDGENNWGQISPLMAASIARQRGVRIMAVAVGNPSGAPVPIFNAGGEKRYVMNRDGSRFLTRVDEKLLQLLAALTHGVFFKAGDVAALEEAYRQIGNLTRSQGEHSRRRGWVDLSPLLLLGSVVLLAAEGLFRVCYWRVLSAAPRSGADRKALVA